MDDSMITYTFPNQDDIIAQINIEGLFILCIDETNHIAQFAVYDLASRHSLSLRVSEILKPSMDYPETLYNPCISLDNLPPGDIVINPIGDLNALGDGFKLNVYKSDMDEIETDFNVNNLSSPSDDHARDYRWIANLDHDKFRKELFAMPPSTYFSMRPGIISRKVQVSHGTLYTGDYADRFIKWAFESLAINNNPQKLWKKARLARIISIAVPGRGSIKSIDLSIGNPQSALPYTLSLPVNDESYYEINVTNLCHDTENPDLRKQGDFQFYYDVIIPDDIEKRIDFLPMFGTGTDRTPCDPIFLGGPGK